MARDAKTFSFLHLTTQGDEWARLQIELDIQMGNSVHLGLKREDFISGGVGFHSVLRKIRTVGLFGTINCERQIA